MSNKLDRYGIRPMYKGIFLEYVDKNYIESGNFQAYIGINDLILGTPSIIKTIDAIDSTYISNRTQLNIQPSITNINSVICKPLYINDCCPCCINGESVMVFIFDDDIKKIYYAKIDTESPKNDKITFRKGKNFITISEEEIEIQGKLKVNGKYIT